MIDWVKHRAEVWGRQVRWVFLTKDGWPSRSALGKLIEEGVTGAGSTRFIQHYPEVMMGEPLQTHNIIKTLPVDDKEMFFLHYVVKGMAKVKAAKMGLSKSRYYERLDRAHTKFSIHLSATGQNSQFPSGTLETPGYRVRAL